MTTFSRLVEFAALFVLRMPKGRLVQSPMTWKVDRTHYIKMRIFGHSLKLRKPCNFPWNRSSKPNTPFHSRIPLSNELSIKNFCPSTNKRECLISITNNSHRHPSPKIKATRPPPSPPSATPAATSKKAATYTSPHKSPPYTSNRKAPTYHNSTSPPADSALLPSQKSYATNTP